LIRSFDGHTPKIAESAFVSETAYVVGDVEIGENTGVWPGAVIRGDLGTIKIGSNTQVEDNCVLHVAGKLDIGDNVIIGHAVVVHCRSIGNDAFIGSNCTLLDDAEIGNKCMIGAHSMVSGGQKIPDDSFLVGTPAQIRKESASAVRKRWHDHRVQAVIEEGKTMVTYAQIMRKFKESGL
jgi:carbonic anhydrase/acetyltransferase-like protein (isoleucine patch superfamily)